MLNESLSRPIHDIEITFDVTDTVPPYFNKINMNETRARTIDVTTESHKTVILQCFADGMPKPRVTWYKVYVVPL